MKKTHRLLLIICLTLEVMTAITQDCYFDLQTEVFSFANDIYATPADEKSVHFVPECEVPTGFHASDITQNTITVEWDNNTESYTTFQIVFSQAGTIGGANFNNPVTITGQFSYQLSNLQPSTSYDIFLRRKCVIDPVRKLESYSNWIKITVTTTEMEKSPNTVTSIL